MTRRSRIIGFGSAALIVVAGVVAAILIGGGTGEVLALVLVSLGLVLATSLLFLEVGLSEDRELARERRRRELPAPGSRRRSLGRMRGRRRRL